MLKRAMFSGVCLLALAGALCLCGCGTQPAGASSSGANGAEPKAIEAANTSAQPSAEVPAIQQASLKTTPNPKAKLKPGARTKVLPKAGDQQYDRTFDDLRFEMTVGDAFKRSMLTEEIEALVGQRMRIRGYILPPPQKQGVKEFVLLRDNQECCFGPGAALYDCIFVRLKPGVTTKFTTYPVTIDGKFDVREIVMGGKHLAIYHIDGDSVK
jgi:hypothetical protein